VRLPDDPIALAAALPDTPCWVQARWMLQSAGVVLRVAGHGHGHGAIAVDRAGLSGAVVGRPGGALLRDALAGVHEDFELIVQLQSLDEVRAALPGWRVAEAVVHSPTRPYRPGVPPGPGVVVCAPPEQRWLDQLPADIRCFAQDSPAIAVRVVQGSVAAVCVACAMTETLWDVGIDTFEGHRRRGHATACFEALANHLAASGRQPVWGAFVDYPPSLGLAAKLGFRPAGCVAVLFAPRDDG